MSVNISVTSELFYYTNFVIFIFYAACTLTGASVTKHSYWMEKLMQKFDIKYITWKNCDNSLFVQTLFQLIIKALINLLFLRLIL